MSDIFQDRVDDLEDIHVTKIEQQILHVLLQSETGLSTDEVAYHGVSQI